MSGVTCVSAPGFVAAVGAGEGALAAVGEAAWFGAAKNAVDGRSARGFTRMMKFVGLIVNVCLVSS